MAWQRGTIALFALAAWGCGDDMGRVADGGAACLTEDCSDPDPGDFACQDVIDVSGRPVDPGFLDDLDDSFARIVLQRPGECPTSLAETMNKLRIEDRNRCAGDDRAGMVGRVVSHRAQLLGKPEISQAVVTRRCGRRLPYELMFEVPQMDADNPELPASGLQVVAYDASKRAFNFYELTGEGDGAVWSFHGNSFDFIDPTRASTSSCAGCHTDGGLIMREIDAPWLHWESGSVRTSGADELIDRFVELGAHGLAPDLASTVRSGNERWGLGKMSVLGDPSREDVHGGSTAELLRPLFCDTSLNLQSAGQPNASGRPLLVSSIPTSFFVDPLWEQAEGVDIDAAAYLARLTEVGSTVPGVIGAADTFFGFTFVERSAADTDYVRNLIREGGIDLEFALDVLSVDFTQPMYSAQRCALLEFAPTFTDLDNTDAPAGGAEGTTSCCVSHPEGGCDDAEVEACVCDQDAYCCDGAWDQSCVNRTLEGDASCGGCSAATVAGARWGAGSDPLAANPEAATIRNAFFARLDASNPAPGSAAAQLRDNLATEGQVEQHRARVVRFLAACRDRAAERDPEGMVADVTEVAAWRRREAMETSALLDEPDVIARDDLSPPLQLSIDPLDCTVRAP